MRRKSALGKIGVFWDMESCPIPGGVDPDSICQKIKSALAKKGICGKVPIRAYAGNNTSIHEIRLVASCDSLFYAGIRLVNEESGSIVDKMQKDILIWALENPVEPGCRNHERPNLVVIAENVSADTEGFGQTLRALNLRDYNVIAVLPNEVACPYASSAWLWDKLI